MSGDWRTSTASSRTCRLPGEPRRPAGHEHSRLRLVASSTSGSGRSRRDRLTKPARLPRTDRRAQPLNALRRRPPDRSRVGAQHRRRRPTRASTRRSPTPARARPDRVPLHRRGRHPEDHHHRPPAADGCQPARHAARRHPWSRADLVPPRHLPPEQPRADDAGHRRGRPPAASRSRSRSWSPGSTTPPPNAGPTSTRSRRATSPSP